MADPNIREIQVTAKQLVFLFMASVVLAVAVFLLGVSVGRGVRDKTTAPASLTEAAASTTQGAAGEPMPPATELPPNTLKYPGLSNADGSSVGASAKADTPAALPPQSDVPDVVSEPAGSSATKDARATVPPPAPPRPEPAPKVEQKPAELPAPPKTGSGWSLQINAFRSRENADKQVASLKAKGYGKAFVAPPQAGGLFRVRVGPYADRAEADRVAARLKQEGFAPSVTR